MQIDLARYARHPRTRYKAGLATYVSTLIKNLLPDRILDSFWLRQFPMGASQILENWDKPGGSAGDIPTPTVLSQILGRTLSNVLRVISELRN